MLCCECIYCLLKCIEILLLSIQPTINDWIALIALNVTVVGLSSLAEKRTVIGVEYGRYLMDKYRLLGVCRVYSALVWVAVVNCISLFVLLHNDSFPLLAAVVFILLVISSMFVLDYLFSFVLRVHPKVKRAIYREQLLGLYVNSDTPCDFEGDRVIGMPPGDRTSKKITSDVQHYFDSFNSDTITAFHEVFGPESPVYWRDRRSMRIWRRLGKKPHNYKVNNERNKAGVVHISWEFFQMFRFSELQDRWLLEILKDFNLTYADAYPRLRLLNIATIFGQINRVGFAEGLYRYKFLDYMFPYIEGALSPVGDDDRDGRVEVERYFHVQFGKYIYNTLKNHPTDTFKESADKAFSALICVDKFRGVLPVRDRLVCYRQAGLDGYYGELLKTKEEAWIAEVANIKNIVFDFGNVLVGWNPDYLYGEKGENYRRVFLWPALYRKFRKEVLSAEWLRDLDATLDESAMSELIKVRGRKYPWYRRALKLYKEKWLDTLDGSISNDISKLIDDLPEGIKLLGLSNWSGATFGKAKEAHPVLNKVKEYVISGGLVDNNKQPIAPKPSEAMFKYFFGEFGVSPANCLFIDDTYDNVRTARSLNMRAVWFLDADTLRAALDPILPGRIKWGENRTLWVAPDIKQGVKPEDVVIAGYDDSLFSFEGTPMENEYDAYKSSLSALDLKHDGSKCMLTGFEVRHTDKKPCVLSLQLRHSLWHRCQYVWHYCKGGTEEYKEKDKRGREIVLQKEYTDVAEWHKTIISRCVKGGVEAACYPNSLCLHLVIETKEGNVIWTRTSSKKENDYPARWACTIGEQIEIEDFRGKTGSSRRGFVLNWLKRAIKEEFGLKGPKLWDVFDQETIRVLALDLEEDIYNFALVCTVKLKIDFREFLKRVKSKYDKSEIADIQELAFKDIPTVLFGRTDNNHEYHPSTYMRLYLFFLYKGRGQL